MISLQSGTGCASGIKVASAEGSRRETACRVKFKLDCLYLVASFSQDGDCSYIEDRTTSTRAAGLRAPKFGKLVLMHGSQQKNSKNRRKLCAGSSTPKFANVLLKDGQAKLADLGTPVFGDNHGIVGVPMLRRPFYERS